MDNKTLKAFVIEQKEQYGLTYQEISDKLAEEYGVVRSRQALQGMYQRAIKVKDTTEQKERFIASADIVNVYCLGYNMTEVKDIVNGFGFNLSYNDVVKAIKEQKEYIENVEHSIIKRVESELNHCHYITELVPVLDYKGITPTDKKLKHYIAEAYKVILSKEFADRLMAIYDFTDDKSIAKKVEEDLKLELIKSKGSIKRI